MLSSLLTVVLLLGSDPGDTTEPGIKGPFAAPIRLMAGERAMGGARLYPSPVLHDIDGDNLPEMIIGDLMGALTVSRRGSDRGDVWSEARPLKGADGKNLKFHNW